VFKSDTPIREGLPEDFPKIAEFVKKHVTVCNPELIGGHWLIAERDGEIVGTIWFFGEHPNAYVDYWIGQGKVAAKLLIELEIMFRLLGIRYVRAVTHASNTNAKRMATDGIGAASIDNYTFFCKELINGPESRTDHNTTGS
jgi:hypothetical protein